MEMEKGLWEIPLWVTVRAARPAVVSVELAKVGQPASWEPGGSFVADC
jgi:hypothetical protein